MHENPIPVTLERKKSQEIPPVACLPVEDNILSHDHTYGAVKPIRHARKSQKRENDSTLSQLSQNLETSNKLLDSLEKKRLITATETCNVPVIAQTALDIDSLPDEQPKAWLCE